MEDILDYCIQSHRNMKFIPSWPPINYRPQWPNSNSSKSTTKTITFLNLCNTYGTNQPKVYYTQVWHTCPSELVLAWSLHLCVARMHRIYNPGPLILLASYIYRAICNTHPTFTLYSYILVLTIRRWWMHDAQMLTQPDSVRQWWTFVGYARNIALAK